MIITRELSGSRVDFVLSEHEECKKMGMRARKRLCEEGYVFVNGKIAKAQYKVLEGQNLEVRLQEKVQDINFSELENIADLVVKEDDNFIAFYKKSGLDSAKIIGGNYSLEDSILVTYPNALLLNRLDRETAGIVMVAKHKEAESMWKQAQERGDISKKYRALVEGNFQRPATIDFELDLSKTKVRCLDYIEHDKVRHTKLRPIEESAENLLNKEMLDKYNLLQEELGLVSLVECSIFKGARHQIRAHLASIGFPLVGDSLYGGRVTSHGFLLYHYALESNLFTVNI